MLRQLYAFVYWVTCVWFKLFGKQRLGKILGIENLPDKGPFIIAANHLSYMDDFLVAFVIKQYFGEKLYVPTNIKAFCNPIRRVWHTAIGGVPIDPSDKKQTYATLQQLLQDGKIILMFPEGSRSDGEELHPFKFGTFNLAQSTGATLIAAGLIDTHKVLPKGSHYFCDGQQAHVTFSKPWLGDDIKAMGTKRLKDACIESITDMVYRNKASHFDVNHTQISATHLGKRAESLIESLLEFHSVETLKVDQVQPILELLELRNFIPHRDNLCEVQYARATGFSVMSSSYFKAVFKIGYLKNILVTLLECDTNQPYANYMMGLFHMKTPYFAGGRKAVARQYFQNAYDNAERYNLAPQRFVLNLAQAKVYSGDVNDARELINSHFNEKDTVSSARIERRYLRAEALSQKLASA
jgi:1-acyl-sn-glycerol-3-phosphate acyltransferase